MKRRRVLILIEDGSFLLDNRVQRETKTLVRNGWEVNVICPRYPGEGDVEQVGEVRVFRYDKWNRMGHFGEYGSSLFKGFFLAWKVHLRCGFDVIHGCNPPDLWFLVAGVFKFFFGVRFVFDQHDVCPELLLTRFHTKPGGWGHRIMLMLEKLSFTMADAAIVTNESYRKVAIRRGGMPFHRVEVVRNGPDLRKFQPRRPDPALKSPDCTLVGYIGNMNPQDGVDHLLMAARILVHEWKKKHLRFVLIGEGDSFPGLREKTREWDLSNLVSFTGRIPDDDMIRVLSSCDICVQPDPLNPLNDISTMNKAMEYMALEKPVVAYDLLETRFSCGECALYASPNHPEDLAEKILLLSRNPELREEMGKKGRKRIEEVLAWPHQEQNLIEIYSKII